MFIMYGIVREYKNIIRKCKMTKNEIFKLLNENPVFYLATMDGDQPRVRGMLLYKADENGIIFHTSDEKEVFSQIKKNPKAELCFSANGIQIRVTGVLEQVSDEKLRAEIFAHPTRKFLHLPYPEDSSDLPFESRSLPWPKSESE